jgi:hypothetical protein
MNLLCLLGFHDWEVVGEDTSIFKLKDPYSGIRVLHYNSNNLKHYEDDCDIFFPKKKVCLRCKKCINEVNEWKEEYIRQEELIEIENQRKNQRKKLAKEVWKNYNVYL